MTRRLTACIGKQVFTTKEEAHREQRRHPWLKVYRCLTGEHWHLAHKKAKRDYVRFIQGG